MEALLQSFFLVALSEFGDKTQLLALVLALRFKRPWTILLGILLATLLNHGLASATGGLVAGLVRPEALRAILAFLFLAFGVWILIPDRDEGLNQVPKYGALVTTIVAFFFAEMGDKTQLATLALGAKFQDPLAVTVGTTLGMIFSDGIAVFSGERLTRVFPMKFIRYFACGLFIIFAVVIATSEV